jgi:Ca2+/Na+ antiporter
MSGKTSISILRVVLGVVLAGYSAVLVMHQLHGKTHTPLLVLGAAELVAAILFLVPRTSRWGGLALLLVFASAACIHLLHGEYDVAFLAIYCAAVWAVISNEG